MELNIRQPKAGPPLGGGGSGGILSWENFKTLAEQEIERKREKTQGT